MGSGPAPATTDKLRPDYLEFPDRHDFVAHDFETGRLTLPDYLARTVFYRTFHREDFVTAMFAQSRALPGAIDYLDELAATGLQLAPAAARNQSRMMVHRSGDPTVRSRRSKTSAPVPRRARG